MKKKEDNTKDIPIIRSSGKIGEKYLFVKELYQCTFGKIIKVKSKLTGDYRACKIISPKKIPDINKFNQDLNQIIKFDHPNLLKLYEIFEDESHIYLITDLCTGGELFQRVYYTLTNNPEAYTEKEVSKIFKQIISALHYCHSQGIPHRDLRPENILYLNEEADSPIKIIDCGLSRIYTSENKSTDKKKEKKEGKNGPIYYLAPDFLNNGNLDERADIWNAGLILYILLCSVSLFNGADNANVFKSLTKKKYNFPEEETKLISDEAKDLLKHMICDPEKRFNAENIYNSEWVQKCAQNATEPYLNFTNLTNLQNYISFTKLRKYMVNIMVEKFNEKEIEELKKIFEEFDVNKDGTITVEELKNGVRKLRENGFELNPEIFDFLQALDVDGNGKVEYADFMQSALEQEKFYNEENLKAAFALIDRDGSGKISKNEMHNILNLSRNMRDFVEKYIKEIDLDGDGEIDYQEFLGMVAKEEKQE